MKRFKFVIFGILMMFSFCSPALAFYGNSYSDVDRSTLNNYGVNKIWKVTSSNKDNVMETPYVDASLKIYDYANIISESEETDLKKLALEFKEKHHMDMVILTIDYPYSYDKQNDIVAADFYDYNDFGMYFTNYDGILFYRNAYSRDPFFDMLTFGNAQLYFDDYRYNYILDDIYHDIKGGKYLKGLSDFINHCDNFITKGVPSSLKDAYIGVDKEIIIPHYKPSTREYAKEVAGPSFIIAVIITAIIIGVKAAKNKMVIKATSAGDYVDRDSFILLKSEDKFLTTHTTSYTISSSSSGGGGGGGHSSFGSSGGGHSSGGGRHG